MCNVSWLQIIAPEWIQGYQQLTEYLPVIQNGYLDQRYKSANATDRWHLLNIRGKMASFVALKYFLLLTKSISKWERKTNKMQQLDIYYEYFLNMFRASLCPSSGEQDVCYCTWCAELVLLDVVGSGCGALRCRVRALWRLLFNVQCSHPTTQRPTTATNHIQQNQRSTPRAVTHVLFSWRWA